MAFSLGSYSMLVSLVFVFMSIGPSFAKKHTMLKKICSKTIDRDLCMKLMKSDSRTVDTDMRGLTEVAIDLAYSKAKDIHRDLNSRYNNRINYQFNDRDSLCSKKYEDAIRDLEQVRKLFYDGDYKSVAVQVNDATEEVRHCKNQYENSASYSSDIRTKEFQLLCDVVKDSSKSLSDDSCSSFTQYP